MSEAVNWKDINWDAESSDFANRSTGQMLTLEDLYQAFAARMKDEHQKRCKHIMRTLGTCAFCEQYDEYYDERSPKYCVGMEYSLQMDEKGGLELLKRKVDTKDQDK